MAAFVKDACPPYSVRNACLCTIIKGWRIERDAKGQRATNHRPLDTFGQRVVRVKRGSPSA